MSNATIYIRFEAEEGTNIHRAQGHFGDGRREKWHFPALSSIMQCSASCIEYRGRDKNMTFYNHHLKKIEAAASSAAIYISFKAKKEPNIVHLCFNFGDRSREEHDNYGVYF